MSPSLPTEFYRLLESHRGQLVRHLDPYLVFSYSPISKLMGLPMRKFGFSTVKCITICGGYETDRGINNNNKKEDQIYSFGVLFGRSHKGPKKGGYSKQKGVYRNKMTLLSKYIFFAWKWFHI